MLCFIYFLKRKATPTTPHVLRQVFSSQHPLQPQNLLFPKVFSPSGFFISPLSTSPSALPLFIAYVYLCPAVVWMSIPLLVNLYSVDASDHSWDRTLECFLTQSLMQSPIRENLFPLQARQQTCQFRCVLGVVQRWEGRYKARPDSICGLWIVISEGPQFLTGIPVAQGCQKLTCEMKYLTVDVRTWGSGLGLLSP